LDGDAGVQSYPPFPWKGCIVQPPVIVSNIHNHSTNCGLVLPDFATVLYLIAETHTFNCRSFVGFLKLLCSYILL